MHDIINGAFQVGATLANLLTVRQLYRHKKVRGIHWATPAYCLVWGMWNLIYYSHLGQTWSTWAASVLLTVCLWRLTLMIYYIRTEERRGKHE